MWCVKCAGFHIEDDGNDVHVVAQDGDGQTLRAQVVHQAAGEDACRPDPEGCFGLG